MRRRRVERTRSPRPYHRLQPAQPLGNQRGEGSRARQSRRRTSHLPDLRLFGGSALTDSNVELARDVPLEEIGKTIPASYVPARNTIFLSLALGFAETRGASEIWIGVNQLDYSGYPDCRPDYIDAYVKMARLATKMGVEGAEIKIETPLLYLTKAEIIKLGSSLGVDYSLTRTCYDLDDQGRACGRCESCVLRKRGFEEAGVPDPTPYR